MKTQHQPTKGFTLVELLVVVSILALLVSVLLPSLSSARERSRIVACGANLRSIGQLINIYAVENKGRIPRGPSQVSPDPRGIIATTDVWVTEVDAGTHGATAPSRYTGLGMLSATRGKTGNEMLFCPSDDTLDYAYGKHIGYTGTPPVAPFGASVDEEVRAVVASYLYRQMDAIDPGLVGDGRLARLGEVTYGLPPITVQAKALALDRNFRTPGEMGAQLNHGGERANVLYLDSSVHEFENDLQQIDETAYVDSGTEIPWASIGRANFMLHLDRIFIAADTSAISEPQMATAPTMLLP